MKPPVGLDEIRALYGDPRPFLKDDGTVSPLWEARMTTLEMPTPLPLGWNRKLFATRVRVNQAIVDVVKDVFAELEFGGLWSLLTTYDGGYTFRLTRGGSRLSSHSFGAALDFDAPWNKLGRKPTMNPKIVRVFESHGWTWGGQWRRPDGMHFQFGRRF
jgi:hypothetical protein